MRRLVVTGLALDSGSAAEGFYREWLPRARELLSAGDDVVLCFAPGDHAQRGWRLAAIQDLARQAAPLRVNGVAGAGPEIDAIVAYLADAPGVTGQYLAGDGFGAGETVGVAG